MTPRAARDFVHIVREAQATQESADPTRAIQLAREIADGAGLLSEWGADHLEGLSISGNVVSLKAKR